MCLVKAMRVAKVLTIITGRICLQKLGQIKKVAQDDDRDSDSVVLISDNNIKYEILVKVMDTSRRSADGTKLFPSVSIAGGTNQ